MPQTVPVEVKVTELEPVMKLLAALGRLYAVMSLETATAMTPAEARAYGAVMRQVKALEEAD
jgi:hypothetical protein